MTIQQAVSAKLKSLPPEKQIEVLDFIEFLQQKNRGNGKRHSLKGLWADFNIEISEQDIAEVRKEMWEKFASEDV